jgi:hypothetical protein
MNRKQKELKLDGGQAYDPSSDCHFGVVQEVKG